MLVSPTAAFWSHCEPPEPVFSARMVAPIVAGVLLCMKIPAPAAVEPAGAETALDVIVLLVASNELVELTTATPPP